MSADIMPGRPEDVLRQYEDKINLHRFDELVPLISSEATFWFSDGSHSGEAIRAAFEQAWQAVRDETYWLDDLKWIAVGDEAASCTYRFHWKGMVGGQPLAGGGRGTTVLRRESGVWKIIHEHLSRFPGVPASSGSQSS